MIVVAVLLAAGGFGAGLMVRGLGDADPAAVAETGPAGSGVRTSSACPASSGFEESRARSWAAAARSPRTVAVKSSTDPRYGPALYSVAWVEKIRPPFCWFRPTHSTTLHSFEFSRQMPAP